MVEASSDETVMVSVDDLHSAFVVWLNHHRVYASCWGSVQQARSKFSRFLLDAPLPAVLGFMGSWDLMPEQAHRVRLLLSPHARTIIKMYHAKQSSVEVPE